MKNRPASKSRYDQNLVADQPGRMIFFTGLFIAIILGLGFRGLIAPEKIEALVASASQKIHKDVVARFASAEVSLSKNGFPRLAVLVRDVEMTSELACWGKPTLKVDLIELPLSILSLVFEKQPFKKIIAHQTELHLRSARAPCEVKIETNDRKSSPPAVTFVKKYKDPTLQVQSALDTLEIRNLSLQYDPSPQSTFEVAGLKLKVKSHQPKIVSLEAKTHLIKDNLFQYASHGTISAEFTEQPVPELRMELYGNWREGDYNIKSNYKLEDTMFTSTVELKHIPAAQVITALKNYGWLREDLDGRKIWVTLKGHSEGHLKNWQKMPITLTDVRVEGDLGEIEVDDFYANNLQPFEFKPMRGRIKNLDIDRLLEFIKRPRTLDFIGDLGQFTGDLELKNENDLKLSGRHSNMEFIFSNQGKREIQKITGIQGDLTMRQNRWDLSMKEILLKSGKFAGDIKLSADREFRTIDVKVLANEVSLDPAVQKLMSGGGELSPVNSQVQMRIEEGQVRNLKGFIKTPELKIDRMHFERLHSQFDMEKDQLSVQLNSQALNISKGSRAYQYLSQILALNNTDSVIKLKQLNGRFEVASNREMKWNNLVALGEPKYSRIVSDGQWDAQGLLSGQISVKSTSAGSRKWALSGHRDQPEIGESHVRPTAGP